MMKRLISMILAVVLVLGAFVVFPVTSASAASHKDNIINSLLELESYWYNKANFKEKGYYGYGTGEFIDLDFDGNPEFVLSYPCSDYRDVYREMIVYENGDLYYVAGGDEGGYGYPGMTLDAYYNKNSGCFRYFGESMCYISSKEWLEQKFRMYMDDDNRLDIYYYTGVLCLNNKKYYLDSHHSYGEIGSTEYWDYNSYLDICENMKKSYVDANMTTKKINMKEWSTYSKSKKKSQLSASYDAFKLKTNLLSTPKLKKFEGRADGVKVTWGAVSGAKRYRVYRKTSSGWKGLGNTTSTSFVDKTAVAGKKYTYTVKCLSANGKYAVSAYDKTGKTFNYLKTPAITKVGNAKDGVKITWGKVSGAEKYRVYVKSNGSWKTIANTTSTTFTHKDVKSNKSYTYTVRCTTASGKTYSSAYDTKGKSITYIATPTLSKVENTTDGVKVTWKAVTGANNYRVYAKGGEYKSWTKVGDTTSTSFTHKSAKSGVKYTYTVACMSSDSKTRISSFDANGKPITYIASPVIKKTTQSSSGIKLTWGKVSGAAKYRVFVKNGSSWKKLKDTTSTSYTHKGLKENTEYTYTVRCISSTGKSYTSAYNKAGWTVPYMMIEPTEPETQPQTEAVAQVTENVVETTKETQVVETLVQEATE
ncbi:MAG: hypothetical protein E7513_03030 [Ruminococcaceae bacterium]|nr:hypothetical protein [Oscillospiraceae bacterium]